MSLRPAGQMPFAIDRSLRDSPRLALVSDPVRNDLADECRERPIIGHRHASEVGLHVRIQSDANRFVFERGFDHWPNVATRRFHVNAVTLATKSRSRDDPSVNQYN